MFARIFTSSIPETRPDWCDSVGTWRCAHADVLLSVLSTCPGVDADAYVTNESSASNGAKRLFVGYRDNRSGGVDHARRLSALAVTLRGHGLAVRVTKLDGRVRGMRITDRG